MGSVLYNLHMPGSSNGVGPIIYMLPRRLACMLPLAHPREKRLSARLLLLPIAPASARLHVGYRFPISCNPLVGRSGKLSPQFPNNTCWLERCIL